ncbi:helix-turn-helix domain-containing protein [Maritalea mediterranea]|uniref:Chromosomal replication initiator DnaA C-terminal domain-containing protein n=1 Tax=Maritalea mediterranea TaxID=2909667 RepID=A0ABS9E6S7_9HYPH|nr:helix-turn-helix domain-containing protein [Maritalea mediterranea]MCF4097912.1 hypothetical protein [Maritalea mediterranea]
MHIYQIYSYTDQVETDLSPNSTRLLDKDPEARFILNLVACARQVPPRALLSRARGDGNICLARQMAMYLINVVLRRSLTYTGELFDRDRRTVSHACARIEELRERQQFERVMCCFERTLLLAIDEFSLESGWN